MAKKDTVQRELCKSLGREYRITCIDGESVIYRDFGNGFNVEISGTHTTRKNKPATIYLWYGDKVFNCLIVMKVLNVARENIHEVVEDLREYSNELLEKGYDSIDKLYNHRCKDWYCVNVVGSMCHKFYYRKDIKLTNEDKHKFSYGNYTCKELFKTSTEMPVAILQHNDPDFPVWKIIYEFSCLVFFSYELALEYCKDKFRTLDGKVV